MNPTKNLLFTLGLFLLVLMVSCTRADKKIAASDEISSSGDVQTATLAQMDLPGRTLAANCFQCHGTNGYAGELKIANQGASEIISEMNSFRTRNVGENIMYVHAYAYTDEEIRLIADYFSKQ